MVPARGCHERERWGTACFARVGVRFVLPKTGKAVHMQSKHISTHDLWQMSIVYFIACSVNDSGGYGRHDVSTEVGICSQGGAFVIDRLALK